MGIGWFEFNSVWVGVDGIRYYTTTVFFHAANDHSIEVLDWMGLPAPEQEGLTRDELRAECTLSAAPIPGIEIIVQEILLSL